jgi:hypothetical protein
MKVIFFWSMTGCWAGSEGFSGNGVNVHSDELCRAHAVRRDFAMNFTGEERWDSYRCKKEREDKEIQEDFQLSGFHQWPRFWFGSPTGYSPWDPGNIR